MSTTATAPNTITAAPKTIANKTVKSNASRKKFLKLLGFTPKSNKTGNNGKITRNNGKTTRNNGKITRNNGKINGNNGKINGKITRNNGKITGTTQNTSIPPTR